MIERKVLARLLKGLKFSPIILVLGPRQAGKSTLMQAIATQCGLQYLSFDDLSILSGAKIDPKGFIDSLLKPAILDEVQRAPDIFLPVKADVDKNRSPGRYVLTGSANPLVVPHVGDALTGRLVMYHLWPFSQGELTGQKEDFLTAVFADDFGKQITLLPCSKQDVIDRLMLGGFPSLHELKDQEARQQWCNGYLSSLLQKDILDLARIEGLAHLPLLLYLLASRVGSLLNISDVSRTLNTPVTSIRRYLQLLHHIFLLYSLPPWSRNLSKRVNKSPKVYFSDTALALHVLRFNRQQLEENPLILGGLTENFVVMELVKQASWHPDLMGLYHFRTENAQEVDIVLENSSGEVVGIEVKLAQTVQAGDFSGLRSLQKVAKSKFKRGVVLYSGDTTLPFGDNLLAVPLSKLWLDLR